jgi:ABC-type transport system involved in cytochrome c biogenesis permease subunit
MLSDVKIFCFLASYTVALALEVSRLWFRSGIRGIVMLGFVVAGWIAHTAFLYYRAVEAVEATRSPLSSNQDWLLLAAWVLVMVYFYLACYHTTTHFGIFFLPLVLGLITAARFADSTDFPREPSKTIWGAIHGVSIMLATVTVLFGFAAGLMYLGQANRLKRKRPPYRKLRLPSLEWLQTANSRTMLASMLLVGVAVASGIVLNLLKESPGMLGKDPVVWVTLAMFGWLLLHVIIGAFYRPIRQGRKVAYLTLVSFVFLLLALVGMFVTTHGGVVQGNTAAEKNAVSQISGLQLQISDFEFQTPDSGFEISNLGGSLDGHQGQNRGGLS